MSQRLIRPAKALNDDAIEALNGHHTDWGALPNGGGMAAVVLLLRSEEPIRRDVRELLADVLDTKKEGPTWQLVAKRRRPGRADNFDVRLNIGCKIASIIDAGIGFESAVAEVMAEDKISRAHATACLAYFRRLQDRLEADADNEST